MASIELIIDGVGNPGEGSAALTVSSFFWGGDLKSLSVTGDVSEFSAQIVVIQVVDDVRNVFIRCFDDDGNEYLTYACTGARIRGYSVGGGDALRATETYTLECAGVEMTTGRFVAIVS